MFPGDEQDDIQDVLQLYPVLQQRFQVLRKDDYRTILQLSLKTFQMIRELYEEYIPILFSKKFGRLHVQGDSNRIYGVSTITHLANFFTDNGRKISDNLTELLDHMAQPENTAYSMQEVIQKCLHEIYGSIFLEHHPQSSSLNYETLGYFGINQVGIWHFLKTIRQEERTHIVLIYTLSLIRTLITQMSNSSQYLTGLMLEDARPHKEKNPVVAKLFLQRLQLSFMAHAAVLMESIQRQANLISQ
jgi:hypothetical protein